MKDENYISDTDLMRALRLRADTRLRELQRAIRRATEANDRVFNLVFNQVIKFHNGQRATAGRTRDDLRPAMETGRETVSGNKFADTKTDCPDTRRPGPSTMDKKCHRPDTGGVSKIMSEFKNRKNKGKD